MARDFAGTGASGAGRESSPREFGEGKKQDDGADDRQQKTGRVKKSAIFGSGENAGDQTAHDRAANADEGRHPEPHVPGSRNEPLGDQANNKANDNGPDNVEHGDNFRHFRDEVEQRLQREVLPRNFPQ